MNKMQQIARENERTDLPEFNVGDSVQVTLAFQSASKATTSIAVNGNKVQIFKDLNIGTGYLVVCMVGIAVGDSVTITDFEFIAE